MLVKVSFQIYQMFLLPQMGCTISTDVQKDDDIALQAAQEDELPRNFDPQDAAKILHEAIENRK